MADTDPTKRIRELAWAAGLFEGEGCITHNGHNDAVPKLILVMTDEDAVHRFWNAVGVGRLRMRLAARIKHSKPNYQNSWEWRVLGLEGVQYVIVLLWFGLGRRRRARAKEIIAACAARPQRRAKKMTVKVSMR